MKNNNNDDNDDDDDDDDVDVDVDDVENKDINPGVFGLDLGDGGGVGGDGDPIVGGVNSEKKSGYETNLYLYSTDEIEISFDL
ncbi:hypothetical protein HZH68_008550 [Vespula germanica]|uniref:Uncharacterized protein n=1 Tax=Vespula germanica TaxID=30212 RepID=A0A834JZ52_VESGE|nr:hypothetical protein HZH68_008550 [Vespula germanica]